MCYSKRSRCSFVAILAALAAVLIVPSARADEAVTGFTPSFIGTNPALNLGWSFTPTTNITVTGLGWWDHNQDGLLVSHDIGIWTDGTMLLQGSDTVASAMAGTLVGEFRYKTLGIPINLTAGTTYVIGGVAGTDDATGPVTGLTMSPSVTFGESRISVAGTLTYTGTHFGFNDPGIFGPNFQFFASAPEPGSIAMGAGMVLSALFAFRKRRAA